MTADGKIEIMIASSVYEFEDQLNQICGLFEEMGYQPISSHYKTMLVDPGLSNMANCLNAVESCDAVFGILRTKYGSGIIGPTSITHEEMKLAIELKKPHWFIAHRDIRVARTLLRQYRYNADRSKNQNFTFTATSVLEDIRVIDMYEDTIQNGVPIPERVGHWTDEFFNITDILKVIQTQFADRDRILQIIENMKAL